MLDLAVRLRGNLPHKSMDARRVMMPKDNPSCGALRAMIMAGVDPGDVAKHVYGVAVPSEQSQYALRMGIMFEKKLYASAANGIIVPLQRVGELGSDDWKLLALHEISGINSRNARTRHFATLSVIKQTKDAIRMRANGDPDAPNVIIQPSLKLHLGAGTEAAIIRPDILYARTGARSYKVGEIKSFPDLEHLTDEQDVQSASSQAGVYAVALEDSMVQMGLQPDVPAEAALLFRKPGYMQARATIQPISRDIATARRTLVQRPQSLREVAALLGPGGTLDNAESLQRLPTNFMGRCRSFCPLWSICLDRARAASAPQALGSKVEDLIAAVGSTKRARELMYGIGAPPASDVEREVQLRLQAARRELHQAVPAHLVQGVAA